MNIRLTKAQHQWLRSLQIPVSEAIRRCVRGWLNSAPGNVVQSEPPECTTELGESVRVTFEDYGEAIEAVMAELGPERIRAAIEFRMATSEAKTHVAIDAAARYVSKL